MKAYWYVPSALAMFLLVAGPLAARLHVVAPMHGFLAFVASTLPALVSLAVGVALLVQGDGTAAGVALIIGVLPMAALANGLAKARNLPRINDISTNLDNPPTFVTAAAAPDNQGKDLAYPEAFKPLVQSFYPGLISLQVELPAEQAFQLVDRTATGRPHWHITRIDAQALTLEGEETDGLFQFTDDFVIRVLPLDGSAQIDMRSRSRVGQGDFGANAARIRAFFSALERARHAPP